MKKILANQLNHTWRELYNQFKYDKKLSRFRDNERHRIFNQLLLNYFYECQCNTFVPSKERIELKASEILKDAENKAYQKDVDPERISATAMDNSLLEMTYLPVITDHDENGPLAFPYLMIIGLISIKSLTKFERMYITSAMQGEYDHSYDAIKTTLMRVPLSSEPTDEKQYDIEQYCLRVAREHLRDFLKKELNLDTGFKYPIIRKIKDKFLNGTI